MSEVAEHVSPFDQLFSLGRPSQDRGWAEREPDYVAQFGFTNEHIPQLIKLALTWADDQGEWPEDGSGYAPIHAWRTLGQLGAVDAVEPLLSILEDLDESGDDWYLAEYPYVLASVGPAAIDSLEAYVSNRENFNYPRIAIAHGMCEIAKHHPESRDRVVQILTEQLDRREQSRYELNGLFISYLMDLDAVEAAESIERIFAAGLVDEGIAGDWECVRGELGVEGLGLPQPQVRHNRIDILRLVFREQPQPTLTTDVRRKRNKKLKAKRKQQRKSRKRNRKSK
jgi:hypothetical protein